MPPIDLPDMLSTATSIFNALLPLFLIIMGISFGVGLFNGFYQQYKRLHDESSEKPKRESDPREVKTFDATPLFVELFPDKPKRLLGDDGELLHPIDDLFEGDDDANSN